MRKGCDDLGEIIVLAVEVCDWHTEVIGQLADKTSWRFVNTVLVAGHPGACRSFIQTKHYPKTILRYACCKTERMESSTENRVRWGMLTHPAIFVNSYVTLLYDYRRFLVFIST